MKSDELKAQILAIRKHIEELKAKEKELTSQHIKALIQEAEENGYHPVFSLIPNIY